MASFDRSGEAVSSAGDVNGDGVDDLLIGAWLADSNGINSGSSYVVFGRTTGFEPVLALGSLDGTTGFRLDGASAGDTSGIAVSAAGDVNGDGVDDLLIGAPTSDPNGINSGSSYVVFGRTTGFDPTLALSSLDGTTGFRLDGASAGDESGSAVSAAGDVNGDGVDDLLIGAPFADPSGSVSGSSYVVFGRITGFDPVLALSSLDGTTGFRLDGASAGDTSGIAVSAAGDVNGDAVDDLLIGAYGEGPNGSNSGTSYVVFGRTTGFDPTLALSSLDGTTGFRLDSVASADGSGRAVSAAGDINGDGVDDLLIGAWLADSNGIDSGSSYVVFGRTTGFDPTLALSSLDGTTGFRLDGVASADGSGRAVSAAGDINGDGVDDLLIGAYGADPNGSDSGSSYVVFGRTTGFDPTLALSSLDGTTGFRLDGASAGNESGIAVSAAGDVNGDGVDDLLIGAPFADPNGSVSGSSYVVFGGNDGPGTGRIEVRADQALADFGGVQLGGSDNFTITLSNVGRGIVILESLSVEGSNRFSLANDQCSGQPLGTLVGVNDECTFDVTVQLDQPGLFTGQVIAPYNSTIAPEIVLLRAFVDGVFVDGFEE
ncbi:integrin alpha [Wenzhouxiangella sp. XN79A]|uniref:integrin alpha n=1 Tax=Wenzhouxiangella sp. XN79A TaxID=2724193 RepID=UPI00197DBACA